jgi:hypothetical protein
VVARQRPAPVHEGARRVLSRGAPGHGQACAPPHRVPSQLRRGHGELVVTAHHRPARSYQIPAPAYYDQRSDEGFDAQVFWI